MIPGDTLDAKGQIALLLMQSLIIAKNECPVRNAFSLADEFLREYHRDREDERKRKSGE